MIKKEMVYKHQGIVLVDMLITGQTNKNENREISFSLPLFFDKKIIDNIEKEWKKISTNKNRPEIIPLEEMQILGSYMPKMEMMYVNQYLRDNFNLYTFIQYYIKNITFQSLKWSLVMTID